MSIREIPPSYADFERFARDFEARRFRYAATNEKLTRALLDALLGRYPAFLRRLALQAAATLVDPPMREALGLPVPSPLVSGPVVAALRLRAAVVGLLPPRRAPVLRTRFRRATYPAGYQIDQLGTLDQPPAP